MRRDFLPILTALRFPASAAIVVYHFPRFYTPKPSGWEALTLGVSFFYILSGFILFYNYSDLKDRTYFWVSRLARIWPVHVFTCFLVIDLIPFHWVMGSRYWPALLPANLLLLQAWIPGLSAALSFNGVSWSLSVEAFFYLIFPWLLVALKQKGSAVVLCGTFAVGFTIAALAAAFFHGHYLFQTFNPLCRVFEFAMGMCTCHWWQQGKRAPRSWEWATLCEISSSVFLLLVGVLLFSFPEGIISPVLSSWLETAFCAGAFSWVIYNFAYQDGLLSRIFSKPIFIRLGELSFSLYMIHQTTLRVLWESPLRFLPSYERFFLYFVISLTLAYLLFTFVETPMRRIIVKAYKNRFGAPSARNTDETPGDSPGRVVDSVSRNAH